MSSSAVKDAREGVPGGRRRARRPVTLIVLLVLLAIALATSLSVKRIVDDQEDDLLVQRTRELTFVLSSALGQVETPLVVVAGLTGLTGDDPNAFEAVAGGVAASLGPESNINLVDTTDGSVIAQVGDRFSVGDVLDAAARDAVMRASDETVGTGVTTLESGEKQLGFARAAGDGRAIYMEFSLDPDATRETTSGEPFTDLEVAVYAAPERDPDQLLILAGADTAPTDGVGSDTFQVGSDEWLVEAAPRGELVGSAAAATPWIVLGTGTTIALVAALLVEVLTRRQQFAETVAERRAAELAEAQEQLVRSERLAAIGGLASAVGHELRNPLGVISNAHYLLRSKLEGADEQVRKHLTTAERETAAATLIVSDLLEFARARDPIPTDVRLDELVAEALEVAPPPAGIEVRQDVESAVVRADRDQLRQVILNLLTNGYDALDRGGQIGVETVHADGAVRLRVWDTGTGIDDATKEQIFEPFWTSKAKGIGLGLTVTRRIVEAHGGTVSVGDRPGGGTQFELELPAAGGQA